MDFLSKAVAGDSFWGNELSFFHLRFETVFSVGVLKAVVYRFWAEFRLNRKINVVCLQRDVSSFPSASNEC